MCIVCPDWFWEKFEVPLRADGFKHIRLRGPHAVLDEISLQHALALKRTGTNLFCGFTEDEGARLRSLDPREHPHAKMVGGMPDRLYIDTTEAQTAYEPSHRQLYDASQEAGFMKHKPVAASAMALLMYHQGHIDLRDLYGASSAQIRGASKEHQTRHLRLSCRLVTFRSRVRSSCEQAIAKPSRRHSMPTPSLSSTKASIRRPAGASSTFVACGAARST